MKHKKNFDILLVIIVLLLTFFGIIMVYSSSFVEAEERFSSPFHFFIRQVIWAVTGLTLMFIVSKINYHFFIKNSSKFLFIFVIMLVIVLFLPEAQQVKGASRWLPFGYFKIQPSEFIKYAFIWYLAYFFGKSGNILNIHKKIFNPLLIFGLIALLILMQPDLGTTVVIGASFFVVLFVLGLSYKYLFSILFLGAASFIGAIYSAPYRRNRIFAFLDPWSYRFTYGYHIINSLMAVGAGGFLGVGLGQSRQKLHYLPEPYADFIYAIICEELGFIGAAGVILLFMFLFFRGWYIIKKSPDVSGFILGLGILITISVQALINIGVVLNLFPTKGLPLPFISYGGSSLVILLVNIGILLNISRHINDKKKISS
ncbi:MAG: putative lipid II flippase FtsW [Candidatus Muiribacteriota bacterium]